MQTEFQKIPMGESLRIRLILKGVPLVWAEIFTYRWGHDLSAKIPSKRLLFGTAFTSSTQSTPSSHTQEAYHIEEILYY